MYKIEIWQYHNITKTYENKDVKNVLEWYKKIGNPVMIMGTVHFIYIKMMKNYLLKK